MRRIQFPVLVQPELGRLRYRRIVLGVALVAFGWFIASELTEGIVSFLTEDLKDADNRVLGVPILLWVMWKVYSQPRRWGFGIGLFLTAFCSLGIFIGVGVVLAISEMAKTNSDLALASQEGRSLWERLIAAFHVVVTLAITAAFLSLRWLYPKVPPPLPPQPSAAEPLTNS